MTRPHRTDESISKIARGVLESLWRDREQIFGRPMRPEDLLPIPVRAIITEILELNFEEPDEILPDIADDDWARGFETAGLMDRDAKTIQISRKFSMQSRQFTAAHEIGHWMLHPGLVYHRERPLRRDRPLNSPDHSPGRDSVEREADRFAAQLVMPPKMLTRLFQQRFRSALQRRCHDDDLAFWLSPRSGEPLNSYSLDQLTTLQFAVLVAKCGAYEGRSFEPLSKRFGVSPVAMGIQLVSCGLVS